MRDATREELESVDNYIKSISKSTGINFYDVTNPNFVNFKWENRYECGDEIINSPITLEGKCIGVITGVDDDYVYGKAFAEVLPELNLNTHTVENFEFSESCKR